MDGGWKAAAGASPLREKMGRGCISWPVQCWIRYPYNAHCHSVPSTEVVYKCELPLSSRLRKYMKRRSSYLTMNQIPCLSNKNTNRTGQKSKQISAGIKVHVTYISHICNAYDLTAALSETAEWLKNDFRQTSMDAHWAATAFGSLARQTTHTHTHTYMEWRPISTRVFSPSRWIADALLARALPWAFCSGLFVASRDLSVCDLLPSLGLHGDESGPHPFFFSCYVLL